MWRSFWKSTSVTSTGSLANRCPLLGSIGRILSGLSTGTALLLLVFTVLDVIYTDKPTGLDLWTSFLFLMPKLILVFKSLILTGMMALITSWEFKRPGKKVLGSVSTPA